MGLFKEKGEVPNVRGRPPELTVSDELIEVVRGLGILQCSVKECARFLRVSHQTWNDFKKKHPEIQEAYEQGYDGEGKISLRRKLWRLADKHPGAAIFLAKNVLGMTDKHEIAGPGGGPVETRSITSKMTAKEAADAYAATLRS